MTEQRPQYLASEDILCTRCHCVIGRVVNVGGVELLEKDGLFIETISANHKCGEPFYWRAESRILARLIARKGIIEE